jgi:putative alpha-1,2-mannosidase
MLSCNALLIWDTHRTLNPWLVLFKPEMASSIIQSLLTIARDGGDLPKWPLANVCAHFYRAFTRNRQNDALAGTLAA